jgi:hypothetical protein
VKAIPIHNPSRAGSTHCSPKRAAQYIARGRAVLLPDGTLQFTQSNQEAFHLRLDREAQAFDDAVLAGRWDGVSVDEAGAPSYKIHWNGAYTDGAYPPGCNVQFKRIPWRASRSQHAPKQN